MKFLLIAMFSISTVASAQSKKKVNSAKASKAYWCCIEEDEQIMTKGKKPKKMCLRSRSAPSDESKSKLAKKYAKQCSDAVGEWIKQEKPKK